MVPKSAVALALADTLLSRDSSVAGMAAGAVWAFDAQLPWIPALCAAIAERCGEHFHAFSRKELADIILAQEVFGAAFEPGKVAPQIVRYCIEQPLSAPAPAWLSALSLPALATVGELARWLDIRPDELAWFANKWRVPSSAESPLQHYHYRWMAKRSGGARLIEIPKKRLRLLQQKILRGILDHVPPHQAAHGFRRGRSCLTHASLHTGRQLVLRMDLKDFFPSIPASRVQAMFARLGYGAGVAGVLARLCVNRTPAGAALTSPAALSFSERHALRTPHLPQGSPCSPALANACAFRLDVRLDSFAKSMLASYSRYADDLVFSGGSELARGLERFHIQVAAIALEEGFAVNTRKTRGMRQGTRQEVTGVVVNAHANLPRAQFDALKAILTNCVRHGPQTQNREGRDDFRAWLTGRVAYAAMVNPARGARLHKLLHAVVWTAPSAGTPNLP
ncbi:MAG: reverse transcriptase family protein [Pseudomonadota bacterium]